MPRRRRAAAAPRRPRSRPTVRRAIPSARGTPSVRASSSSSSASRSASAVRHSWHSASSARASGRRPHDRRGRGRGERGGPQHRGERVVEQRPDRGPVAARLPGAGGQHQQHREAVEPPGEVAQEAQRRLVGPVHVVDGEHQRRAVGQVDGEPVQAVRAAAYRDLPGPRHDRCGERGRARQQLLRTVLGERGREQLSDQPVGRALLQLAAARGAR